MEDFNGKILAGRYKIDTLIGQGGMAYVYSAIDVITTNKVAIKILKPEYTVDKQFVTRFEHEAFAASKMNHTNIIGLLDVGLEDDIRYLVLEFADGRTLKEVIEAKNQMDIDTACNVTIRILSALQHAHNRGIIHRDIKPQNILVDSKGNVKVSDFGIARIANIPTITKNDMAVGTVQYVSPEQAQGKPAESASDLYSTAIVLYEMITGKVPFTGESAISVVMQQINSEVPPISNYVENISPCIEKVIEIAMKKAPQDRFKSADDMANAIKDAMNGIMPIDQKETKNTLENNNEVKENISVNKSISEIKPELTSNIYPNSNVKKRNKKLRIILFSVSILAVFIICIQVLIQLMNITYAPDIEGLTLEEATVFTEKNNLNIESIYINHTTVKEGYIINQTPLAQSRMYKGDTILVNISKGAQKVIVPNIIGLSQKEAVSVLSKQGLTLSIAEIAVSADVLKDNIISQIPKQGESCNVNDVIQVTVSGGSVVVPELIGMSDIEAKNIINERGLQIGEIGKIRTTDKEKENLIVSQNPESGALVAENTIIAYSIAIYVENFESEVNFILPKMDQSFFVRITLKETDGEETTQYFAKHDSTQNTDETITKKVYSKTTGTLYCNLYINDELIDTVEVSLK